MKIKRHLIQVCLLLAALLFLPVVVEAQFTFTTNNESITITGYTGAGGDVIIPDTINGLPVTTVGPFSFYYCLSLVSVTIPDSVTTIGDYAFARCNSLGNVIFGKSVNSLGNYTFWGCANLSSLYFQAGPPSYGFDEFNGANNAIAYFQEGISGWTSTYGGTLFGGEIFGAVPTMALTQNESLTITSPQSGQVVSNGEVSISGVASDVLPLTGVWFQINSNGWLQATTENNWTNWKATGGLFVGTNELQVYAEDAVGFTTNITTEVIYACDFKFETNDGAIAITGYTGPGGVTDIPATINGKTVTTIGKYAFLGVSDLTSVTIPRGVTNILAAAFFDCRNLRTVNFGPGVTSIGDNAFAFCKHLTKALFEGAAPTKLGSGVFVFDPLTVFYQAGELGWRAKLDRVSTVAVNEVAWIVNPTNNQHCGDGVFTLSGNASGGALPVSSVWVQVNSNGWQLASTTNRWRNWTATIVDLAPGTNVLQAYAEDAVGFDSTNTSVNLIFDCDLEFITSNGGIAITGYTGSGGFENIPDTINGLPVTSIAPSAFQYCENVTGVTIPNSVTNIGQTAFWGCWDLTNVTIPNSVISIGNYAFWYCWGMNSITLGTNVAILGDDVFNACLSLSAVYFEGNAPTSVGSDMFLYTPASVYYLPETTGWTNFSTVTGVPTVLWLPQIQTACVLGGQNNQFGFTINWAIGQTVVVKACTNLANQVWTPIQTLVLTNGTASFDDLQWTNYPTRFYGLGFP